MRYFWLFIAVFCFTLSTESYFSGFETTSLVILGFLALYRAIRWKKSFNPKLKFNSGNKELDRFNTELFNKAITDYNKMEREIKTLNDKSFRKQLQKTQGIAKNFLTYLQEHPERIGLARRFIDYYQDRAILLVQKYKEFDRTGLQEPEVEHSKREIKQLLHYYDEAYADQFTKVLNSQLIDLDAEMKVMRENMSADGLNPNIQERPPITKANNPLINSLIELSDKFLNRK